MSENTGERVRLEREYFENLYESNPDPWDFETSEYERRKYAATLDALGGRRFGRALEVGCSIGVFTALLAENCDRILAVDASERAVGKASERLEGRPGVDVVRCTIPEEMPVGNFDLIVASEVLYYLPEPVLLDALSGFEDALAAGGTFVAVHWRRKTRTYPLQGDEVHGLLISNTTLNHIARKTEPDYALDVFVKGGGAS